MFFPFTFTMAVPGSMNPFSKPPDPPGDGGDTPALEIGKRIQEKQRLPEHRPHPSTLPPPEPLARKRGWQPSDPEPSPAATITASTRGYLNVHPRYRDFTVTPEAREEDEGVEMPAGEYLCVVDYAYNPVIWKRVCTCPSACNILRPNECTWRGYTGPCLLLMDTIGTRCMFFTLIYSLALLWMILFFMVVSLCICIELPPAKRRRTLAGTIVSGALNAALIGTAVGLTVYRLYVPSFS